MNDANSENAVTPPQAEATPNNDESPQSPSLLDRANATAERLEKQTTELKALLDKQEALMVEQKLGGVASAGKTEKKEESDKEYKDRIMRGEI